MKIHYIHIGKTGGTSIMYALSSFTGDSFEFVLHSHETVLRDIPHGEKFFFSVRDPVTRFQSAFYSRQRQGRPRYDVPWSESEAKCYRRYSSPERLAIDLDSRLPWKRRRAKFAMSSIMHINRGYWDWFESEKYLLSRRRDLIFVLSQDNLDQDFDEFKKVLSIDDQNVTLPQNDLEAFRNPQKVNYVMSSKAVDKLRDWYIKDYEFLSLIDRLR